MTKRIFTKILKGEKKITGAQPALVSEHVLLDSWLVQEDIEIIGAYLHVSGVPDSAWADAMNSMLGGGAALSQHAVIHQDGEILSAAFHSYGQGDTGTVLAERRHTIPWASNVITFPTGSAIPVKEEGVVYLHLHAAFLWAVTEVNFSAVACVYYTKKG